MKDYNVEVLFKNGYILNMPKELVSNDFNSTKLNLSFDIEGRVLFKMLFPDKETFIVDEVKDNTIIFKEGYLSQEGIYLIEFAIHDENGRLTNNVISEISVRRELVSTNDIVEIDDRVPVLDGLIQNVNDAIEKVNNMENSGGTGTGNYTLPIASVNTLGGIKVGANLTIEADGTLNAKVVSADGGIIEETDPIFSKSASANITSEDIENWNNKANTSDIPTKMSDLTNDSGFIAEVPSEYITDEELTAKGYLTEHQDISNLATKSELHSHSNKTILDGTTASFTTEEKTKLSGVDANANNYSLPTASDSVLGGIKVGDGLTITDGILSATSPLKGKKITVIGDSLSTGYTVGTNWVNMLAERTGSTTVNLASDGATIAYRDNDNGNNFMSKLSSIPTDSDYVVIMGGGNDMMQSIDVGSRSIKDNTYKVSGAVFQIIVYLETNLPSAKIMFITEPPVGSSMHESYTPYQNIILEMCAFAHIPCFNMTNNFGLNPTISQVAEIYWLDDYIHLTEVGQEYMSYKIQKFLENEIVNNNENAKSINGYKLMILTANEYTSLGTKDENTIYITKDQKAYLGSMLILGGGTSSSDDSGDDTTNESVIDQTLWDTLFKITKYAGNDVINNNPTLEFSGISTGALITNLSEEEATYSYGATISNVATTLEVGKTISVELEVESSNVKTLNMGFYYGTGSFGTMTQIGSQQGTFTVSHKNSESSAMDINGIGCMIDVNDSTGYTVKMTIKSITIS